MTKHSVGASSGLAWPGNCLGHLPPSQKKCEVLGGAHGGEGGGGSCTDPGGGETRKQAASVL